MFKGLERLKTFFKRYREAKISVHAASLAYHSLLGIVPMVGLVFWYLKHIGVTKSWADNARAFFLSHLNINSSQVFAQTFDRLTKSISGNSWGWIGLAIFTYTSISLVIRIGDALDDILGIGEVEIALKRKALITLARRLFVLVALPIFLALSLALTLWLRKDSWLRYVFDMPTVGSALLLPLSWFADTLAFFMLYFYVPNRHIPWKKAAKFAVFVTPAFELGKFAMRTYSLRALATAKLYGALAVIPLFMLWAQVAWIITLTGVLFLRFEIQRQAQTKSIVSPLAPSATGNNKLS